MWHREVGRSARDSRALRNPPTLRITTESIVLPLVKSWCLCMHITTALVKLDHTVRLVHVTLVNVRVAIVGVSRLDRLDTVGRIPPIA